MATAQGCRKSLFVDTTEGCSLHHLAPQSVPNKISFYFSMGRENFVLHFKLWSCIPLKLAINQQFTITNYISQMTFFTIQEQN